MLELLQRGTLGREHSCHRCGRRIYGPAVWQVCGLPLPTGYRATRATVWHVGCAPQLPGSWPL